MAAMLGIGQDIPRANNIYVPKPLPAKADMSRLGRSHSMFMPAISKPAVPLEAQEKSSSIEDKESEEQSENSDKKDSADGQAARKRMNVYKCPHTDRKHYAKNMCNNCYHKQGRNKKATKCPHKDRQNYAKGKCQNCYLNDYHKVKRKMKKSNSKVQNEEEVDRRVSFETSSSEQVNDNQEKSTPVVQN